MFVKRVAIATFYWVMATTLCWGIETPTSDADWAALADVVQPFFETHCYKCHGPEDPESDFALHDLAGPAKFAEDVGRWEKVVKMLASGEMPPEDEKQPKKQDRAKVVSWIKAKLIDAGHTSEWDRKLLFPEYGNYVDHEQLFAGSVQEAPWSPSRLWKKSPHIFDSMVMRGIGLGTGRYGRPSAKLSKVKQPFTMEDKAGIREFAAIMYADSATLGTMLRNAELLADKHLEGAMHERHVQVNGPIPEDQLPQDKNGKPIRPRFHGTAREFSDIILSNENSRTTTCWPNY